MQRNPNSYLTDAILEDHIALLTRHVALNKAAVQRGAGGSLHALRASEQSLSELLAERTNRKGN